MRPKKHTYDFLKTHVWFSKNIRMISQKHTYDFSETHLWFFRNTPMIFQKHTYVFPETYLCFFRNIPMIFQKHTYVFSETYLWFFRETGACFLRDSRASHYALCLKLLPLLSLHDVPAVCLRWRVTVNHSAKSGRRFCGGLREWFVCFPNWCLLAKSVNIE